MITIQTVTTVQQCQQIGAIEMAAWGGQTYTPDHILITIARHKGVVLLAYDDELPIGFCISFLSFVGENAIDPVVRLKHHSHMAGVIPEYQGKGVGAMIKWTQREQVLRQRVELMTWTFDPLETRNGRLNIAKLGAVCCTYKRSVYGMMNDELNAGVDTDRFQVDWWLASDHVEQHAAKTYHHQTRAEWMAQGVMCLNSAEIGLHPTPQAADLTLLANQNKLLLAVPSNFQTIKRDNLDNAIAWRLHTRDLFEAAFANQFTVTDLIHEPQLSYYLLEKNWEPSL